MPVLVLVAACTVTVHPGAIRVDVYYVDVTPTREVATWTAPPPTATPSPTVTIPWEPTVPPLREAVNSSPYWINVRRLPSMDGDVIGSVRPGETVELIAEINSEWIEISLADGTPGFVARRYFSVR